MSVAPSPYTLVGYAGVDVSSYQRPSEIDWREVRRSGSLWAYVKATEGQGYVDPSCFEHAVRAESGGVAVGYYHFARPDSISGTPEEDARAEATDFLEAMAALPKGGLPPVLDWEKPSPNLGKDGMAAWALTFLSELEDEGCYPVIYTGRNHMRDTTTLEPDFTEYPLWQPWYREGRDPWLGPPEIAEPWSQWSIYQYSGTGRVSGYEGPIDVNVATRDFIMDALGLDSLINRPLA